MKTEQDRGVGGVMSEPTSIPQLPTGWISAPIGELISHDGVFIDGDWVESKDQDPTGDVRLIQLADIGDGTYRNRSNRFLTSKKAADLGCTFLKPGDILVARMPDPLGRACIFPGDAKRSVTVVDVCIVRVGSDGINNKWLMSAINSIKFRAAVASLQSGSTRKRISRGNLATLKLPVPPAPEQDRIVAKIEELFTKLDAGVASLRKAHVQLKRYRQAVLKAAVTGELTREWREAHQGEFEPASELLACILKERRAKWEADQLAKMKEAGNPPKNNEWKSRYKPPPELSNPNLPVIPEGWGWVSADQICSQITDGEHIQPRYQTKGFPMLTAKNVRNGYVDFADVGYIAESDFKNCLKRCAPQENDILIVSVGATTGRAAIVADVPPFAIVRSVLQLRPLISPRYLLSCVQSTWCQTWISRASGSSAQAHLYILDTKKMPVPLPSFPEQQLIVDEVERALSIAAAMDQTIEQSLKQAERMRQSILKQAFEGTLVAQDPTDEPAELLLERIKQEQARREAEKRATSRPSRRQATSKRKHIGGAAA